MRNGHVRQCKPDCECTLGNNYEVPSLYKIYTKNCHEVIDKLTTTDKKNFKPEYIFSMAIAPNTYECTNMQSTSSSHDDAECLKCYKNTKNVKRKRIKHCSEHNSAMHSFDVRCDDPKHYLRQFGVKIFYFFIS